MSRTLRLALVLLLTITASPLLAEELWTTERFEGLELRSIGPALMSGRIADVAISPHDENHWVLGAGSGGVWKTLNAGVTWTPIFDAEQSYSIGCVTLDPRRPDVIWVGTGENVGGRHVAFGDGVYRSDDGGKTWKHKGLADSQHISKIVLHPTDPDVVWVAAQGPLWSPGGERGIYRSEDGGDTWTRTLGDDEWVGATDLVIDPRDPDRLVAATWQRHRTVAAYLGGGPGTGLHRSTDGGKTWEELTEGLPDTNMGKIGLAISPQNPDVLYAAIELDRRTGGVFRSTDGGSSWEKRSEAISGGTGPHYYQELYASPHQFDRIYLADVRIQVSDDGGTTFHRLTEESKHSDNHAMTFRPSDPDYLLVGTDGGLYESFDLGANWRFMANLPLTQFYKIAVDDAEPFFNVYGGTQDNATEGGPSRTDNLQGIQNSDWGMVLDWDGHQPATEPGNPDILYGERQEGFLSRIDMSTGETVDVQPQPDAGEGPERYNWDAPILVSPHQPSRIYFASHRVWRSDDRGDSWTAISGDLTRGQERFEMPIMGATQSWDNAWDLYAMSTFGTITSLSESPAQEGLLWAGTDDGLLQVREPGAESWRAIEVGSLPGVPKTAFINDVRADLHDADAVVVALDDHKSGDFKPYLVRSTDRGKTWRSMRGDLPDRTLVWRIVQDHIRPELFFLATERGLYFTVDAGKRWTELTGGVPTISFRDLTIHRRDDDLVAGSFGRGIYLFDDIGPFRELSAELLEKEAALFTPRHAWWYVPRGHLAFEPGRGDQGAGHFIAPNPPFGAVFTYHLKEDLDSRKTSRKKAEEELRKAGKPVRFAGWDAVEAEQRESAPRVWLTISDTDGNVIRRIQGPTEAGFHRVAWDLRHPAPHAVELVEPPAPEWGLPDRGLLAAPGTYTVALSTVQDGVVETMGEPRSFEVVPLRDGGALEGASTSEVAAFWRRYEDAIRVHSAMQIKHGALLAKAERLEALLERSNASPTMDAKVHAFRTKAQELDARFGGHAAKQAVGEKIPPRIEDRLFSVSLGIERSTYGPTATHRRSLEIAEADIRTFRDEIEALEDELSALTREIEELGGAWFEGEDLPRLGG